MKTTFAALTSLKGLANRGPVAVAGAAAKSVLGAVDAGITAGVRFLLFGDRREILRIAEKEGLRLEGAVIEDIDDDSAACTGAARAASEGRAAVMMKGLVQTSVFTRSILDKNLDLTPPGGLLSHVGFFADPRDPEAVFGSDEPGPRPFLLSDGAIKIDPKVEDKKAILVNAVAVARSLGAAEPRAALVAPVEKVNPRIGSTVDAASIKEWVAGGGLPGVFVDGPFGLDVAVSAEAAAVKGIPSVVAGRADILIMPGLDAGNAVYKTLTTFAGAPNVGILAGARVPVVLNSRADTEETKAASLAFALRIAAGGTLGDG